jgi:hypothetical protein
MKRQRRAFAGRAQELASETLAHTSTETIPQAQPTIVLFLSNESCERLTVVGRARHHCAGLLRRCGSEARAGTRRVAHPYPGYAFRSRRGAAVVSAERCTRGRAGMRLADLPEHPAHHALPRARDGEPGHCFNLPATPTPTRSTPSSPCRTRLCPTRRGTLPAVRRLPPESRGRRRMGRS